jgi:hypothetical protein
LAHESRVRIRIRKERSLVDGDRGCPYGTPEACQPVWAPSVLKIQHRGDTAEDRTYTEDYLKHFGLTDEA